MKNIEIQAEAISRLNKLAVFLPGYLDNCNYDHLRILSEDLAKAGYFTIRFNPTGTWDSKGAITDYCLSQYLEDIDDVINYAADKNGKEFDQIIICGHSFGGQTALQYGLTHDNIDLVVGIMPSFGKFEEDDVLKRWRESGFKRSVRKYPDSNEEKEFFVPYSFLEDRKKYPIEKLNKSNTPKLIIAGELDDVVNPDMVKAYFDGFSDPKEYKEMSGMGHDYRLNHDEILRVNRVIVDFLTMSV